MKTYQIRELYDLKVRKNVMEFTHAWGERFRIVRLAPGRYKVQYKNVRDENENIKWKTKFYTYTHRISEETEDVDVIGTYSTNVIASKALVKAILKEYDEIGHWILTEIEENFKDNRELLNADSVISLMNFLYFNEGSSAPTFEIESVEEFWLIHDIFHSIMDVQGLIPQVNDYAEYTLLTELVSASCIFLGLTFDEAVTYFDFLPVLYQRLLDQKLKDYVEEFNPNEMYARVVSNPYLK